ncbi:MAG: phospholipase A [Nitrospirota bacterium]
MRRQLKALVFLLFMCPAFCLGADTGTGQPLAAPREGAAGEHGKFADKLFPNEPLYFVGGTNSDWNWTARFQISFKYLLTDKIIRGDDSLFLGYTQTSVWDLSSSSVPFYDTSYRPSLFYEVADTARIRRKGSLPWLQVGYEHESNGKAGADSRSMNIVFVRPCFYFGKPEDTHFRFAPKVWAYVGGGGNSEMEHYRGYADLLGILEVGKGSGFFSESQLAVTLRKGAHGHYGSVQADGAYPLGSTFYLHLQYFNGFGETILDYNKRETQYRLGIMLITW